MRSRSPSRASRGVPVAAGAWSSGPPSRCCAAGSRRRRSGGPARSASAAEGQRVVVTLVGPQVPQVSAGRPRRRRRYKGAVLRGRGPRAGGALVGFNMGLSDACYDEAAALDAARRRRATVVFFAPTRLELGRDARALKKAGAALVSDAVPEPHAPNWKQSGELANDVVGSTGWACASLSKWRVCIPASAVGLTAGWPGPPGSSVTVLGLERSPARQCATLEAAERRSSHARRRDVSCPRRRRPQ